MWIVPIVGLFLSVTLGHAEDSCYSLEGKYAIVTGAAQGIGLEIVKSFLEKGARLVVIVDKNEELGEETTKNLACTYGEDKVKWIHGDITKNLDKVDEIVMSNWGNPDILVNNAGICNEYDLRQTIETNLIAPIEWSMRMFNDTRIDHGGNGSTILNILSWYSYAVDPMMWNYKTASYGFRGFTLTLGHETIYEKTGVRVLGLCPGYTRTNMTAGQITTDEFADLMDIYSKHVTWQTAEDVGKAAATVMETADSGTIYSVIGGELFVSPSEDIVTADYIASLE